MRIRMKITYLFHHLSSTLVHTASIQAFFAGVSFGHSTSANNITMELPKKKMSFCNNALNGAQAQSPSRRVEKPETNPDIFEIWVKYVYSRRIFTEQPGKTTIELPWPRWSKCYSLDACTDACFEILSDTPAMHKEFPVHLNSVLYVSAVTKAISTIPSPTCDRRLPRLTQRYVDDMEGDDALNLTLTIRPRSRLTLVNRISKSFLALIATMKFSGLVGSDWQEGENAGQQNPSS
ncbi:hypothetical protein HBI55_161720 [Parastagonospora nodorum]|nr:hypothetical protein HBI78_011250 [Parastagonospora nodorum]KAH5024141.1 hypothetical protein HBI77_015640 [Parastagonospora nodorum]KAH5173300.1 hypothetical protein HBH68_198190 [Parastagonospora nodorum]KAH5310109.1 hypothetical protein HBI50_162190 [Parastagonospora nodorum]KAH5535093.1 hypothetical protein HBI27_178900 [Parastagonospora nodorum]